MKYLEKNLNFDMKRIKVEKIRSDIQERILTASSSISVDPTQRIDGNILLIDDATGSGATLNEAAKKIRKFCNPKIKIIDYTVVGRYKGFDVISEV